MAVGVNLGIMWDINDEWSLGFSYRSKLRMKVTDGTAALRMIDDPAIAAAPWAHSTRNCNCCPT